MKTLVNILIALFITACGADEKETKTETVYVQSEGAALDPEQGPKGDKGDKGDTGAKGEAGVDGQLVTSNMWYDPVEDRYWLIGVVQNYNPGVCPKPYKMPSLDDLEMARRRGLFLVSAEIGGPTSFWTSDKDNDNSVWLDAYGVSTPSNNPVNKFGIACVEDL